MALAILPQPSSVRNRCPLDDDILARPYAEGELEREDLADGLDVSRSTARHTLRHGSVLTLCTEVSLS